VDGQGFSSGSEFARLVAAEGPLRLSVENQGRLRSVELTPLKLLPAKRDEATR
jgi:hypothetical protein